MTTTPDIFISYSREDQAVARRYGDALKAEGFDSAAENLQGWPAALSLCGLV